MLEEESLLYSFYKLYFSLNHIEKQHALYFLLANIFMFLCDLQFFCII